VAHKKILLLLAAAACIVFALMFALGWWFHTRRKPAETAAAVCSGDFDLVIRGGTVLDGLGHPPVQADVGVRGGRIACVGLIKETGAARVIEAAGLVVAPGFIDVHTHVERTLPEGAKPFLAPNFVRQGVTTLITGNCGTSRLDVGAMLARLDRSGSQVNVATFVGHNSVRRNVMQRESRAPTPQEMDRMKHLVAAAMDGGALGLSTGLAYVPGAYASREEVVELARVAAQKGGFYVSHIRDEGINGYDAVAEAISVGESAGLPVHISHFKASGRSQWGTAPLRLGLVDDALRRGMRVTIDQYPYTASSTSLDIMLPSWALAEDSSRVAARLRDPQVRARVLADMLAQLRRGGWDDYKFARIVYCPFNLALNGLTIPQASAKQFAAPVADGRVQHVSAQSGEPSVERQAEVILDLIAHGGAQMIYFDMDEQDVTAIMRHPDTMFGSDSSVRGEDTQAVPHPRGFGTFPRVLASYVRENHTLTLEEAIRRMTSLPAHIFGLGQRGQIAPGFWADLVIFQEQSIGDRATYDNPLIPPVGISDVIVNGGVVFEDGHLTGAMPGRAIRHDPINPR
jgi:N-acyl-D-aspartate/D-glutamate deacylase